VKRYIKVKLPRKQFTVKAILTINERFVNTAQFDFHRIMHIADLQVLGKKAFYKVDLDAIIDINITFHGKKGRNYPVKQNDVPTMKDVAREAGVSLGTVSKVINGIPVGEHYRKRVEAATRKLGYRVNDYARGLKTNKTNCVALVMPSLRHPFFAALVDELTAALARCGYRCMLMLTQFDSQVEQKCFEMARQNKIDGVIALTYSPDLDVDDNLPVVTIDRHLGTNLPCVSSDNYWGGVLAAEKLMELGCKDLLYMSVSAHVEGEVDKRRMGFESACNKEGIHHHCIVLTDEDTEVPFYQFLEENIREGKLSYDGIFCNGDALAVRVKEFLEDRGVGIPEDVQVIGYDGIVNFATGRFLCSTIVQPIPEMAEAAVKYLLMNQGALTPTNITLPVYYAPGGTTRD